LWRNPMRTFAMASILLRISVAMPTPYDPLKDAVERR
jgi:hypothetical protein